ncbi:MAG: hypothetical protein ACRD44_04615 [Bryobacteraceae bacterium]
MLRPVHTDSVDGPRGLTVEATPREVVVRELELASSGERTGDSAATGRRFEENIERMTEEIRQLRAGSQRQLEAVLANTVALERSSGPGVVREALEGTGSTLGKTGFLLSPLISGIRALFGGGEPEPPPALVRYELPPSIRMEAGLDGGSIQPLRYGQDGLPRVARPAPAALPPITVQVQAMDSRSFLDHSAEIASAVRQAILSAHSLSDVVADL